MLLATFGLAVCQEDLGNFLLVPELLEIEFRNNNDGDLCAVVIQRWTNQSSLLVQMNGQRADGGFQDSGRRGSQNPTHWIVYSLLPCNDERLSDWSTEHSSRLKLLAFENNGAIQPKRSFKALPKRLFSMMRVSLRTWQRMCPGR